MKFLITSLLSFIAFMSVPAVAQDFSAPLQMKASPVVIELFSSQACPACPPADAYIGQLMKSDGVIALSCHVDYFGRNGTSLGRSFCTDRQTKYIKQIGRASHYTPQMMVNGHMDVIGYEKREVTAKIVQGRSERVSEIIIEPYTANVFNFSIPARKFSGSADILLAVYDKPHRSFKRGRSATYYNVISHYIPLGQWNGGAIKRPVFPVLKSNSAGFAIIVQDSKTGKVLAAGKFEL